MACGLVRLGMEVTAGLVLRTWNVLRTARAVREVGQVRYGVVRTARVSSEARVRIFLKYGGPPWPRSSHSWSAAALA